MKNNKKLLSFIILGFLLTLGLKAQDNSKLWHVHRTKDGKVAVVNFAIDKMAYWKQLAADGIIPYNPQVKTGDAKFLGSKILSSITDFEDSPDVCTFGGTNHTQSENSIFVDPNDNSHVFNSNNSTDWSGSSVGSLYGTSSFFTSDAGENWTGTIESTGGSNSGDPAACIDLNGRMYSGFIHSNYGQGVAYSDNGTTWTSVLVASAPNGGMLDKNHLWVDNSPTSPYSGNLYDAWTDFDYDENENDICISRSTNSGESWSTPVNISNDLNAGSHNQGVNIQTGPNGNVYVVWSVYESWPASETALGFAKSTDGGATYQTPTRIITNIKGIRQDEPTDHRVNSFPSMTVDQQTGDIYIVWTNIGVPGTNSGTNQSVYMIKSSNEGTTWSTPVRVNQNTYTEGEYSYFPWISCDPVTGALSVIFYDTRNTTGYDVETWVAVSLDGGDTWEDFRVSDVSFTTKAIPGLAGGYMGDYLGIASLDGNVYPVWSDDRDGVFKAYTSPFSVNLRPRPTGLDAEIINLQTGATELVWNFNGDKKDFVEFNVYRNDVLILNTTDTTYIDVLPSYGTHKYQVSAQHTDGESAKVSDYVEWGIAMISVTPDELTDTLLSGQTSSHFLTVTNNGQIDLIFDVSTEITNKYSNIPKDYCAASGGGDEYISGVVFGTINNTGTSASGYSDYTNLSTEVNTGETYDITITNGNIYDSDDLGIWIDFNQDSDFEDAGENVVCAVNDGADGTYQITIPSDATSGETTMRIRLKYFGDDCGSPCGTTTYGEVEDYSVNIMGWLSVEPPVEIVEPGQTIYVPVNFDATDFLPGTYTADIHINSNAANFETIDVPVTMVVADEIPLTASPLAIPQNICNGESATLFANAAGGEGSYTYTWTDGGSFSSNDENPVVSPTETTTYYLTIDDGTNTIERQVTVNVYPELVAPDKPWGNIEVGNNNAVVKYYTSTVENATQYEWSVSPTEAGSIFGITDTAFFNPSDDYVGTALIKVRAINDCGEGEWSQELQINIIEGATSIVANTITLSVYPNPTEGIFIFNLNSKLEDNLNIQIYNIAGQLVYSDLNHYFVAENSMYIDISNQPAGIYIINVSGKLVNENITLIKK